MESENISPVSYPGSFIERLVVFQSFRQFVSYVMFSCVAFLGIFYIFSIAGRHVGYPVLIGALVGGFPAVLASMRAEFQYYGPRFSKAFEIAKNATLWSGYRIAWDEEQHRIKLISKLPWPLRWRESNVIIEVNGSRVTISGPAIVAHSVRRRLKNELSIAES